MSPDLLRGACRRAGRHLLLLLLSLICYYYYHELMGLNKGRSGLHADSCRMFIGFSRFQAGVIARTLENGAWDPAGRE